MRSAVYVFMFGVVVVLYTLLFMNSSAQADAPQRFETRTWEKIDDGTVVFTLRDKEQRVETVCVRFQGRYGAALQCWQTGVRW